MQKMRAALVKAAEAVCAKGLKNADINVSVVVLEESFTVDVSVIAKRFKIVIEKLLAKFGRKIGFRVKKKRGEVVL